MRKKIFAQIICLIAGVAFMIPALTAQTSSNNKWTAQKASKWVKQKKWQKGLSLNVAPSTDKIAFATQYHKNQKVWDEAFGFMRDHDLNTLPVGKYPIDGDKVYASVSIGPNKDFDNTKWESHRKYIDLQYVISGKEKIGVAPVATATVIKPYDESNDIANYTAEGKFYIAEPGTFFLFFPANAHRPSIKVDGYDVEKKLVIKIQVVE